MKNRISFAVPLLALAAGLLFIPAANCERQSRAREAVVTGSGKTETAYFGGGCFWCIEAVFEGQPGVQSAVSGYAGGDTPEPSYEGVSTGRTGHAEVVKIEYDPAVIDYPSLLKLFFQAHDPTTLNRQGADEGTQYRSIILYTEDVQKEAALEAIRQARLDFDQPVVTELKRFEVFFPAEEYHQDFYRNNRGNGYCVFVISPKMKKLGFE